MGGRGRGYGQRLEPVSEDSGLDALFPYAQDGDFTSLPRMKQFGRATEPERGQQLLSSARLCPVSFPLVLHRVLEPPLELSSSSASHRSTWPHHHRRHHHLPFSIRPPSSGFGPANDINLEATAGLDGEVCVLREVVPRFVPVHAQSPNRRRWVQSGVMKDKSLPGERHKIGHPRGIRIRRGLVHEIRTVLLYRWATV